MEIIFYWVQSYFANLTEAEENQRTLEEGFRRYQHH